MDRQTDSRDTRSFGHLVGVGSVGVHGLPQKLHPLVLLGGEGGGAHVPPLFLPPTPQWPTSQPALESAAPDP